MILPEAESAVKVPSPATVNVLCMPAVDGSKSTLEGLIVPLTLLLVALFIPLTVLELLAQTFPPVIAVAVGAANIVFGSTVTERLRIS